MDSLDGPHTHQFSGIPVTKPNVTHKKYIQLQANQQLKVYEILNIFAVFNHMINPGTNKNQWLDYVLLCVFYPSKELLLNQNKLHYSTAL